MMSTPADATGETADAPESINVIAPGGELILSARNSEEEQEFLYRVKIDKLVSASGYFARLLEGPFAEAIYVSDKVKDLKRRILSNDDSNSESGFDFGSVDPADLPKVSVISIGMTSKLRSIREIMADFLRALHGEALSSKMPPLLNVANLVAVADRFDSLKSLRDYVQKRRILSAIESKLKQTTSYSEDRERQKLLVGILLDYKPWTATPSKILIIRGSQRWYSDEAYAVETLWHSLPYGLEGELMFRRECVLDTIKSLQSYCLNLYLSGERQCKLGYSDSSNCDSFQLGEMTRFFYKIGTLRLECSLIGDLQPAEQMYSGDIAKLLASIRSISEYQINQHHQHCGLRSRLLPIIEFLEACCALDSSNKHIGICGDCWRDDFDNYRWLGAKPPAFWTKNGFTMRNVKTGKLAHENLRAMMSANERDWDLKWSDRKDVVPYLGFKNLQL